MNPFVSCALLAALLASPDEPPTAPARDAELRARYLITATDDFVVDLWHNGRPVPDARRTLIEEIHGATAEKIDLEVKKGDWIVFHVVNNRLRWGGASYFGVAGCFATNETGFTSRLDTNKWSACDDPSDAERFITEKDAFTFRPVKAIDRPWDSGDSLMRRHAGESWEGQPIWGSARSCWIKVLVD